MRTGGAYDPVLIGKRTGCYELGEDDSMHAVVANPMTATSMELDDMETDRGRARRPTIEPPRSTSCTCELPQCTSQMAEDTVRRPHCDTGRIGGSVC